MGCSAHREALREADKLQSLNTKCHSMGRSRQQMAKDTHPNTIRGLCNNVPVSLKQHFRLQRCCSTSAPLAQDANAESKTGTGLVAWSSSFYSQQSQKQNAPAPSAEQKIKTCLWLPHYGFPYVLPLGRALLSFWRAVQENRVLSHTLLRLDV